MVPSRIARVASTFMKGLRSLSAHTYPATVVVTDGCVPRCKSASTRASVSCRDNAVSVSCATRDSVASSFSARRSVGFTWRQRPTPRRAGESATEHAKTRLLAKSRRGQHSQVSLGSLRHLGLTRKRDKNVTSERLGAAKRASSEPTRAHASERVDGNCVLQARRFVGVSSLSLPKNCWFKSSPRNHGRRGLADARAASPFRLSRLHPGIGSRAPRINASWG